MSKNILKKVNSKEREREKKSYVIIKITKTIKFILKTYNCNRLSAHILFYVASNKREEEKTN